MYGLPSKAYRMFWERLGRPARLRELGYILASLGGVCSVGCVGGWQRSVAWHADAPYGCGSVETVASRPCFIPVVFCVGQFTGPGFPAGGGRSGGELPGMEIGSEVRRRPFKVDCR
jgi:hypothetical protein